MNRLFPWLGLRMSRLMDIEDVSEEQIPDKPGVYILSGNVEYIYPWSDESGKSNVFYIGQGGSLRTRIRNHKRHYSDIAGGKPKHTYYWPVYEYGYYHHCKICWMTCDTKEAAKETEHLLLKDFAEYYGARPVANNQSAWE